MKTLLSFIALAFTASLYAQPVKLSADARGVVVDGGASGRIVLDAPTVTGTDKKPRKPAFAAATDGVSATATYADGFVIKIALSSAEGTVAYSFDRAPSDVVSIVVNATLPSAYNSGGTYSTDGSEARPFPAEPGKQLFAQGAFKQVGFFAPTGEGLTITVPASYQQLQDPRVWGLQQFQWIYHYDLMRYPNATGFTVKIATVKK